MHSLQCLQLIALSKVALLTILVLHIRASISVLTGGNTVVSLNKDEAIHCPPELGAPNLEDCRAALAQLAAEARIHDPMTFEWISPETVSTNLHLIQLHFPWDYVHGTCTISIVEVPPETRRQTPRLSTIRTFGQLKSVASRALSFCVLGIGLGGYALEGM
ncbi:MAG: hypothetical protein M1830_002298 [Pleopsidium flavum]|nr:MAG: hypothetical protein M1830_002298 [Pleopsidium flavum]